MVKKDFVPYIPPEKRIPELTGKVVLLGAILAVVMGAANAYLGLYVGMTVSASIPAAVISMAIMRKRGNILENNMVKTSAAAGEALAAGVIFTIPALVFLYKLTEHRAGWETITWEHYGVITAAAMIGGILGVFFTIPLRRILIVDMDLPYPEGVACTEVLKAGERGGKGMYYVFSALGMGMLFKFAGSEYGLRIWKERVMAIFGSGNTKMFVGSDLSVALLGVGYIIGPRISLYVFSGGVIGWLILLPIMGFIKGFPAEGVEGIFDVWRRDTMYVGIGAIVVGGLATLWQMRHSIIEGVRKSIGAAKVKSSAMVIRTEQDFPVNVIYYVIIVVIMAIFYWYATHSYVVSIASPIVMLAAAFFFTAVAGYIAGVVGSSNNPISGVTVTTLLATAIFLLILGVEMNAGMTATILVAAVVCCSAAIAGDCMQELKTGQLLGSTPRNLQIAEFLGVILTALIIGPVVMFLHQVYELGSPALPAPQANVMAAVVMGIFQGNMNWPMFILGALLAFVLLWRKISVMAVAIGVYLPLTLTVPIMIGGIIKMLSMNMIKKKDELRNYSKERMDKDLEESENNGILFSSGLIAGEALMGVIIAAVVMASINLTVIPIPVEWPGIILYAYMMLLLLYVAFRGALRDMSRSEVIRVFKETIRDKDEIIKSFK